ncbi:hypothetical protein [Bordetella avium]|uniref:Hypothetical phage protein n=1 Tax=Bordetella avium (strain 197N) TaxID=360910 RepID=Q2KZA4_BORA1|nr:hypothetical protein [Bordetella avium]RIQ53596.1 hypothetical protein D0843_04910 [Bordetella avium]CAJ47996.1 Hypothetical phage protein [Bordetella avium 197N]
MTNQAIPHGWRLVPAEMTLDMSIAFAEAWYSKRRVIDDHEMQDAYAAMLAAAPGQPASDTYQLPSPAVSAEPVGRNNSKHPIPDDLRRRFSQLEDTASDTGAMKMFTDMRTTVQAYFAATPAADERANVGKVLPEWEQVSAKLECGETLTPLEVFVHYNEPAGDDADAWRDQLSAALASAPVVNPTLPLERALHGLISKICPGLDTGEILQDARWASAALSDIMANTPAADARDALISSIQSAVNEMKFDNFNATKRQMEFIKAGARRVIAEVNAAIAAQQGKGGE